MMGMQTVSEQEAPVLSVSGLRIVRRLEDDESTIVAGIDVEVGAAESVAFVGESGSGKSVTARAIMGLLPPALRPQGEILLRGRDVSSLNEQAWSELRGGEVGMIMQDPFTALNPIMKCADIIGESLPVQPGQTRRERRAEVLRRLAEVGIADPSVADRYPFQLSGGMRQRVVIAAALARDPNLLIADEPTTALDVTTQRGILALLKKIQAARQMSLILITHDLRVAFATCDRVYVIYAGSLVEVARSEDLDLQPLHPYTAALLQSEPPLDRRLPELVAIPGSVPLPDEVAGGCVFAPRCDWAQEACVSGTPPLVEVEPGRLTACVRIEEIRSHLRASSDENVTAVEGPSSEPLHGEEAAEDPVVRVRDLSKTFSDGRVIALDCVSIELQQGECVGIVGESGSGKTTLARAVIGLDQADSGQVLINGQDLSNWAAAGEAARRAARGVVQMVFQDPYSSLNSKRTIGWTLSEAIRTHHPGTRDVRAEVTRLLQSVGLAQDIAQKRPASLSGGMRQRVAIARALAARPRVLICDESVSALDVSVQAQILTLLRELMVSEGLSLLFITHDLSVVRQIADRVYVMHRGRVVESGDTAQIIEAPNEQYTTELLAAAPRADTAWLVSSASSESLER